MDLNTRFPTREIDALPTDSLLPKFCHTLINDRSPDKNKTLDLYKIKLIDSSIISIIRQHLWTEEIKHNESDGNGRTLHHSSLLQWITVITASSLQEAK